MSTVAIAPDPLVRQRGLTRRQWDLLVDAGELGDEHVELVEGMIVEMAPQGDQHSFLTTELNHRLTRQVTDPWRVRVQMPLAATDASEPEPDLAVVRPSGISHPTTAALVVEIAVTSQRMDLVRKPAVYAAAGVQQYWVVDLRAQVVVVHTEPVDGGYATVRRLPMDAPLSVLGVDVDLAALLAAPPATEA